MGGDDKNQPLTVWLPESMDVKNWVCVATGINEETGGPHYYARFRKGTPAWDRVGMLEAALVEARAQLARVMREGNPDG